MNAPRPDSSPPDRPHLLPGLLKNTAFQVLTVSVLLVLFILTVVLLSKRHSLESLTETGRLRVNLYATSLRDTLEKYRHLPYVLARDRRIIQLLENNIPSLRVSPHLEDFAKASGALIYVLDRGGTTVATSNWRSPQSLLGHNFSFRPYFTDARSGRSGGYYAVGLRTRQPGFFLSYPVRRDGLFLGAIIVKVNLEELQYTWKQSGESVIVSDAFGVIFLTSRKEWKYKSLRPLPAHTVNRLQAVQYLDAPLAALPMERKRTFGHSVVELDQTEYLELARQLPEYGWRIHYLTDLKAVETTTRLAATVSIIVAFLLLLCFLFLRERRQKLVSRQEARKAKAIQEINERLRQEIVKHRETEDNLRKTQRELIQTGKLAALGRMSAAIAHELNQPVSAIRTFVASSRILLRRGQLDKLGENLDFIEGLTARMAKITGQLKTFARKSKGREEVVDLARVIDKVVQISRAQLDQGGVILEVDMVDDFRAKVRGDGLQLEQVLSNLIHNALDAVQAAEKKHLELTLRTEKGLAIIQLSDSGPGIAEEALESLFDPFFTTKDIGEGLGLGLSIAYGIIGDMDGTIRAQNLEHGGARFTVELPLAHLEESEHE